MRYIDLHLHSSKSDGKLSPKELVDKAIKLNLKAIAITDHDTIGGVEDAIIYAKDRIKVIPGVEISCDEPQLGFYEVHILGFFIDTKNRYLKNLLKKMKASRLIQKKKIIEKINKLGFEVTFDEAKSIAQGEIGRPHVAQIMIKKYPEKFKSIRQVFDEYIGKGKIAYAEKDLKISIKEAIDTIHKAKGIAILAHPGVFDKNDSLELINIFKNLNGDGIETFYPYHKICPQLKINAKQNTELINFYRKIAAKLNLLEAGGSDFHGNSRDTYIGELKISSDILNKLKII